MKSSHLGPKPRITLIPHGGLTGRKGTLPGDRRGGDRWGKPMFAVGEGRKLLKFMSASVFSLKMTSSSSETEKGDRKAW